MIGVNLKVGSLTAQTMFFVVDVILSYLKGTKFTLMVVFHRLCIECCYFEMEISLKLCMQKTSNL